MVGVVWGERGTPSNRKLEGRAIACCRLPPLPEKMRGFIERAARYICSPVGNVLAMAMRSREALIDAPVETLVVVSATNPAA